MRVKIQITTVVLIYCLFISFSSVNGSIPILSEDSIYLNSEEDVSGYSVLQSVTYSVEINFSLTHISYDDGLGSGQYWFKFSRLDDREYNSSLTPDVPPYQESTLLYSQILGTADTPFVSIDQFNNTYDVFNNTLFPSQSITLSQKYHVKLNEISYENADPALIGTYDTSQEIFNLYCNHSELYYERDDPSLINRSNSIVNPTDNPLIKAKKLCDWVSNYLTYDDTLPAQEKGALWAYDNRRGDCSEYSDLLITLLRIQGIPARKVTGYVVSNNPSIRPYVDQVWNFNLDSNGQTSFLGHAWVEFFVPNLGWIACDPTWNGNIDYTLKVDFLRFNLNVGAWFSIPAGLPDASEFPHPCIVYQSLSECDFQYSYKVTVIDTDLSGLDPIWIIIIIVCISIGILVLIIILIKVSRRRKKQESYY
jgi:transglutaminase-like putative cysteine protease